MIPYPSFDKIAFEIGPFGSFGPLKVHWYGIMYLIAFAAGWFLARLRAAKPGSTWKPVDVDEIMIAFERTSGDADVKISTHPLSVSRLEWEYIQRVLNETAGKVKVQNQRGCQYLSALNSFINATN